MDEEEVEHVQPQFPHAVLERRQRLVAALLTVGEFGRHEDVFDGDPAVVQRFPTASSLR
jgi:hypothetical protein